LQTYDPHNVAKKYNEAADSRGNGAYDMALNMVTRKDSYFVYVLLCNDGSYYTGYSNNPASRLVRHMKGQGARYTRMHKPRGIVYLQELETRSAAMKRERQIKALTHAEKSHLVEERRSNQP